MPKLTVSRREAEEQLSARIAKGDELLAETITSKSDLKEARGKYYTWDDYNKALLRKIFTDEEEAEAYGAWVGIAFAGPSDLGFEIEEHHGDIRSRQRRLASVVERLELFEEVAPSTAEPDLDTQEAIARRLLNTLDAIKESGYQDQQLIQEAQALNARLGPTYAAIYNGTRLIITTYPPRVWFSRAYDQAQQALALASAGQVAAPLPTAAEHPPSDRVFVVHGHQHGLKEAVARLVERLGYRAIVLHELADKGQTVIEKFEREAPDVAFAVVLLTPDDEGRLRPLSHEGEPAGLAYRARQNVVWEFGYFTAVLGRSNVVALVMSDGELERPSDLDGQLYVPVSTIEDPAWRMKLAQEMKAAGLDIDLNRV